MINMLDIFFVYFDDEKLIELNPPSEYSVAFLESTCRMVFRCMAKLRNIVEEWPTVIEIRLQPWTLRSVPNMNNPTVFSVSAVMSAELVFLIIHQPPELFLSFHVYFHSSRIVESKIFERLLFKSFWRTPSRLFMVVNFVHFIKFWLRSLNINLNVNLV